MAELLSHNIRRNELESKTARDATRRSTYCPDGLGLPAPVGVRRNDGGVALLDSRDGDVGIGGRSGVGGGVFVTAAADGTGLPPCFAL